MFEDRRQAGQKLAKSLERCKKYAFSGNGVFAAAIK